jgi:LPXTG-motif cell wall-anchored protein
VPAADIAGYNPYQYNTPGSIEVNQAHLARRLLAGAAGLMIGAAGIFTLATPVHATPEEEVEPPTASFADDCAGTTVSLSSGAEVLWTVTAGGAEVFPGEDGVQPAPGVPGTVAVPSDAGEIVVDFEGSPEDDGFPQTHTWTQPEGCDDGNGLPEGLQADFVTIVTCDVLVVMFRNNGEEEPISFSLTPNEDATHGHAPDFLPLLDVEPDEDGFIEIPPDAELDIVGEIAGGETVGPLGPLNIGDAHAHGFQAFPGLEVTVAATVGDEPVELEEPVISWDEEVEGLGCETEDDGEGGELPITGVSTGIIAGGAVALLVLGGGLFMLARRRRVTFTA